MNPKLHFLLVGFLLSFAAVAQKGITESIRLAAPPVVDGEVDDWNVDWLMDSKSKFLYNISNDSNTLYIRLKIADLAAQQKIAVFGLTVYLNLEGGRRGKLGLQYPIEKTLDEVKKDKSGEGAQEKTWAEMKKDLIRDADMLKLIGLSKDPILSPRVGLMNGIEVIMVVDSYGDLVYEAKIPFKAYRIDKSKVENLGVVAETGKMVIKQGLGTGQSMSYRGTRYARPMVSQPYNEFAVATILSLKVKLN